VRLVVAALAAAALAPAAALGGLAPGDRAWIGRVDGFARDVRANVDLAASGGDDVPTARRALHDLSDLYATLVAYTYFGGCSETLRNLGAPSPRLAASERALEGACREFERASSLFSRAVRDDDAAALVAASRASLAAFEALSAVRARLDALRRS
jgi:hypothetical protein